MSPTEQMLAKVRKTIQRYWDSGQLTTEMNYLLRDLEECLVPACCYHPWEFHGWHGCQYRGEDESCGCEQVRELS